MSTSEKLERLSTEEPEQPRVVFSDYRTSRLAAGSEDSDSDDGGGCGSGGQTQNAEDATSSKATPVAAVSSSYKRSLSRAYSSDFIATRERKASASNCPPCKASRNVGLEKTPATKRRKRFPSIFRRKLNNLSALSAVADDENLVLIENKRRKVNTELVPKPS